MKQYLPEEEEEDDEGHPNVEEEINLDGFHIRGRWKGPSYPSVDRGGHRNTIFRCIYACKHLLQLILLVSLYRDSAFKMSFPKAMTNSLQTSISKLDFSQVISSHTSSKLSKFIKQTQKNKILWDTHLAKW